MVHSPDRRWHRRPLAAGLLRAAVLLVPIASAAAVSWFLVATLPPPPDTAHAIAVAAVLLAVSILVATGVEEAARRASPLVWLLRLSLLFPGRAPSRFRVALRAGNVNRLRRLLEQHRPDDEPARAAELIITLATAISAHDARTRGHSERVRAFTELLAEELDFDEPDLDRLRWAALLHDVGKLRIPGGLLNKPAQPDAGEWDVIRRHPEEGARIAAPLLPWLGEWGEAIVQHHERYDGAGYPRGLAGPDIAFGARIVAVADVFETMTAPRPYRLAVPAEEARRELARQAGRQFDADIVRAFLNLSTARLRRVAGPLAWLTSLPILERGWALREPVLIAGSVGVLSVGGLTIAGTLAPPGVPPSEAQVGAGAAQVADARSPDPEVAGVSIPREAHAARGAEVPTRGAEDPTTEPVPQEVLDTQVGPADQGGQAPAAGSASEDTGTTTAAGPTRQEPRAEPEDPAPAPPSDEPAAPPATHGGDEEPSEGSDDDEPCQRRPASVPPSTAPPTWAPPSWAGEGEGCEDDSDADAVEDDEHDDGEDGDDRDGGDGEDGDDDHYDGDDLDRGRHLGHDLGIGHLRHHDDPSGRRHHGHLTD